MQLILYEPVTCKPGNTAKMLKLTDIQINEIADNLDSGMKYYCNFRTGEIKTIINFDSWIGADKEPWEADNEEIEDK